MEWDLGTESGLNERRGSASRSGADMVNKVVWLIGLSGAGKTTIAEAAARRYGAELLDGDTIRDFFSNNDFSREGRERHLLGIAKMARLMSKHTPVICSFITPYEDVRERILEILPRNSVMVHVSTSLEVCEDRDVKGLYAKARTGEISNFTGISDPFDDPKCAHMTLDSSGKPGHTVVDMVDQLSYLFEKPKAVLLPGRWQPLHQPAVDRRRRRRCRRRYPRQLVDGCTHLLDCSCCGHECLRQVHQDLQFAHGLRPVSYTHLTLPTKA